MERTRSRWGAWPWLLLAAGIGIWWLMPGSSLLPVGSPAPALSVPVSPGGTFQLSEARGHVTLLVFWATWCPACRQEGGMLSQVQARIAPRGDRVVGVSVDDLPLAAVRATATRLAMTFPIALGQHADAERFRVTVLPTAYVIAPDGTISKTFSGMAPQQDLLAAIEHAR